MPLSPTGKIDLKSLPEPGLEERGNYVAPRNEVEQKLVEIWSETLGIEKNEIGTFFPNNRSRYLTHLEDDKNDIYGGVPFQDKYILYSNAFNVPHEVIDSLFSNNSKWKLVKKYTRNRIFIGLYYH